MTATLFTISDTTKNFTPSHYQWQSCWEELVLLLGMSLSGCEYLTNGLWWKMTAILQQGPFDKREAEVEGATKFHIISFYNYSMVSFTHRNKCLTSAMSSEKKIRVIDFSSSHFLCQRRKYHHRTFTSPMHKFLFQQFAISIFNVY